MSTRRKRRALIVAKVRIRWWSLRNYVKGYAWGPVQRFRCCDHTTPYHYGWCATRLDPQESAR